jgi:hypothetical protein
MTDAHSSKVTSADAARRLVGLGVLLAIPTALTGVAEWTEAPRREQRVGLANALCNSTALIF